MSKDGDHPKHTSTLRKSNYKTGNFSYIEVIKSIINKRTKKDDHTLSNVKIGNKTHRINKIRMKSQNIKKDLLLNNFRHKGEHDSN
mmetsp:Transcript_24149/g.23743  ORF Transcript_24149/g.23743 Transcript_24149/m.23743 type:complete len:86 (+) Transcript_24149:155-412(+)